MAYEFDRVEREDGGGSFLMGLLAGTVLGAGLGMLFAPKPGAEVRMVSGAKSLAIVGAPEQVAAQVAHLEAIGVDTLLLVCSFGNLTQAQVCRSLEYFAQAVIRPRQAVATAASG